MFTRVWGNSSEPNTTTSHTVAIGSPANGDEVVFIFTCHGVGSITLPAGWEELENHTASSNAELAIASRICDGTEGATVTVTTASAVRSSHSHCKITAGHSATDIPEVGAIVSGNSTAPDPPSLTPSYGSREYLWIVAIAKDVGSDVTITAFPSGYGNTDQVDSAAGAAGAGLGRGDLVTTATSEDPGAATLDVSDSWVAQTVAVPGAVGAGPLWRFFNPPLDGGLVNIGDGTVRKQSIHFEAGDYTPPIWVRTESGLVLPVDALPFGTVVEAGQMEVLSSDPRV